MADFTQALFRIDPTEGLVDYVSTVKPYHTKLMEVLVEYVYTENIDVTVGERWKWEMTFSEYGANTDVVYSCGYGYIWDAYGLTSPESAPMSYIVSAAGKFVIDVSTSTGVADITIVRNVTGHVLSVGDEVTFQSPLPSGINIGQPYYVVSVTPTLQVSETSGGVPFIFGDDVVTSLAPQGLPYNSFLVQPSVATSSYPCLVSNVISNQLTFVEGYNIVGIDTGAKQWRFKVGNWTSGSGYTVGSHDNVPLLGGIGPGTDATAYIVVDSSGSVVEVSIKTPGTKTYNIGDVLIVPSAIGPGTGFTFTVTVPSLTIDAEEGDVIYINGNGNNIADGQYTVDTVYGSFVEVKENIPPLTTATGSVYTGKQFNNIPFWPSGTKVQVTATGDMPSPLSSVGVYYFIPSAKIGVFNLATTRYPQDINDYVNIASIGNPIEIYRVEPFSPGDFVRVSGSHFQKNDGQYIISTVEPEGSNFRIGVMQSVPSTTPLPLPPFDGVMYVEAGAYDMPQLCPAAKTPGLYASTFIHENLQFTFSIDERDFIGATVMENQYGGWGNGSFGSPTPLFGGSESLPPYTSISDGGASSPTHTILPTGFDLQFFDVGPMDETLVVTQRLQQSYPESP